MNCLLHIFLGVKLKEWNPGLILASIQFVVSVYGEYFITVHGLSNAGSWWIAGTAFSIPIASLFEPLSICPFSDVIIPLRDSDDLPWINFVRVLDHSLILSDNIHVFSWISVELLGNL